MALYLIMQVIKHPIMVLDISKHNTGLILSSNNGDFLILSKIVITKQLKKIIPEVMEQYSPNLILVGLSTHPDGSLTDNGEFTRRVITSLNLTNSVIYVNEYKSTQYAMEYFNSNSDIGAAIIILNIYLASHHLTPLYLDTIL